MYLGAETLLNMKHFVLVCFYFFALLQAVELKMHSAPSVHKTPTAWRRKTR